MDNKTFTTALAGGKNHTTAPSARGNAPLLVAGATTSPGGGSLLSAKLLASYAAQSIESLKVPPSGERWY